MRGQVAVAAEAPSNLRIVRCSPDSFWGKIETFRLEDRNSLLPRLCFRAFSLQGTLAIGESHTFGQQCSSALTMGVMNDKVQLIGNLMFCHLLNI